MSSSYTHIVAVPSTTATYRWVVHSRHRTVSRAVQSRDVAAQTFDATLALRLVGPGPDPRPGDGVELGWTYTDHLRLVAVRRDTGST